MGLYRVKLVTTLNMQCSTFISHQHILKVKLTTKRPPLKVISTKKRFLVSAFRDYLLEIISKMVSSPHTKTIIVKTICPRLIKAAYKQIFQEKEALKAVSQRNINQRHNEMRSQFKTMNKKDSFCPEATFVKNQIKFAWIDLIIIQSILRSNIFYKRNQ